MKKKTPAKKLKPEIPPKRRLMDAATGQPLKREPWPVKNFPEEDLKIVAALRFPSSKAKQAKWIDGLGETIELDHDEFGAVHLYNSEQHYRTKLDEIEKDLLAKEQTRQGLFSMIEQVKYLVSLARDELQDPQAFRSAAIHATNAYEEFIHHIEPIFKSGKKSREGARDGHAQQHEISQSVKCELQAMAEAIRKKNPTLNSKTSIAKRIALKLKQNPPIGEHWEKRGIWTVRGIRNVI